MLALKDHWVWDSWYTFDGEHHHAFYLKALHSLGDPELRHRNPAIGHSRSRDLHTWEELPDAIQVSSEPAFDDWTTWTGSVVRDGDIWRMFYTGTRHSDDGAIQRIGAATSADLITWTKVSAAAIVEADPAHYEIFGDSTWPDQAWRDPWVFQANNQWHMYITARATSGAIDSRGVCGHAISDDLKSWRVLPPLTQPDDFGQMEVFQVEEIDGVPTLLWCCGYPELSSKGKERFGAGGTFSTTGESTLGPFDISKATRFPHESIYAARVVRHNNEWFMLGFRNYENGIFIGEITDPIPVTSLPGMGLLPKN